MTITVFPQKQPVKQVKLETLQITRSFFPGENRRKLLETKNKPKMAAEVTQFDDSRNVND